MTLWLALATFAGLCVPYAPTVIGLCLISIGAGLAWLPLGFMVPGALLLADHVASNIAARGSGRP